MTKLKQHTDTTTITPKANSTKFLGTALWIALGILAAALLGSIVSHRLALLSDAGHMLKGGCVQFAKRTRPGSRIGPKGCLMLTAYVRSS